MSDPQALHAELLAKIGETLTLDEWEDQIAEWNAALRAVLELHKPDPIDRCGGEPTHPHCSARGCGWVWPCRTVKVIAAALGVTTDG